MIIYFLCLFFDLGYSAFYLNKLMSNVRVTINLISTHCHEKRNVPG